MQIAESVGIGHPDKIADVIADKILDVLLDTNPKAQLACEVLASKNLIVVAGEVGGEKIEEEKVREEIRGILEELGYRTEDYEIRLNFKDQSLDIRATSVDWNRGIVSGDQSIAVGYATDENLYYLPTATVVTKHIIKKVEECVRNGTIKGIRYDCKVMVALAKNSVEQLYLSVQHDADVPDHDVRCQLRELVEDILREWGLGWNGSAILINCLTKFTIGGLDADTGSNNRKLIADSYGNSAGHGGGGYSGKDLTKVDRLLAYYARWICKNLVAAGMCDRIELEVIIHYGSSWPSFYIKNISTQKDETQIMSCIERVFTMSIFDIYKRFNRRDGWNFYKLSRDGHFTSINVPWEQIDKVDEIKYS